MRLHWLNPWIWGLVSGLPLALTSTILQAWLTTEGYSMQAVGLASAIGLPYSVKVLWSPLLDRPGPLPGGNRRSWLLPLQVVLAAALVLMAWVGTRQGAAALVAVALAVAVVSASQDIVIDAWRAESYRGSSQSRAVAAYVSAYRIATWLSAGLGLAGAQWMGFRLLYAIAAGCVVVAAAVTWHTADNSPAQTIRWAESLWGPWRDLWRRPAIGAVIACALLYKLGDALAAALVTPFLLQRGYTLAQIGLVAQGIGLWATIGGAVLGGAWLGRMTLIRGLWLGALLQAVSTLGYAILAVLPADVVALTVAVCVENATAGLGTAAFLSYLAGHAREPYTATQYALLSGLAAVPRTVIAGISGVTQDVLGWPGYFLLCTVAALPGMLALLWWQRHRAAAD